jgi:hypothetical protein
MASAELSPAQVFAPIKAQFLTAFQQYPDLYYGVVRGKAMRDDALRRLVCKGIAQGSACTGPSSFTHDDVYSFFYGSSLDGITLLRSISRRILTLVIDKFRASALQETSTDGRMILPLNKDPHEGKKGLLPAPLHYVFNRQDVEHDWMDWVRHMARKSDDPILKSHEGSLREWVNDKPTKVCPGGSYAFLPDGSPVGRAHDGLGNLCKDADFPRLLDAIRKGRLGQVSMLRSDVFSASVAGIDALADLVQRLNSEPESQNGLSPKKVRQRLDIVDETLNSYAKRANVKTPRRGERDFMYPWRDIANICDKIVTAKATQDLKGRARDLLKETQIHFQNKSK